MKHFTKSEILILLLLATLSAGIFFAFQIGFSLRLDESQTIWQTSQDVTDLLNSLAKNVHVPFYHVTFHFWQSLFGNGVVMGRFYSLMFLLATIPALYKLTKKYFGQEVAYLTLLLFTLSPFVVWFGSEVRMYTLVIFLVVNIHYLYLQILHRPRSYHWLLYALVGIVGVYSHYFFWLILGTQFVYFFIHKPLKDQKSTFFGLLSIAGVIVASFIPWLVKVLNTPESKSDPLLDAPKSIDIFNIFTNFFFGFQTDYVNSLLISFWPLIFTLAFFTLKKGFTLKKEFYYFVIAAFLPIILAFIASVFFKPVFLSRYLIITLPALLIVVSVLIVKLNKPLKHVVQGLLLAVMVATLAIQVFDDDLLIKEKYREAALYVSNEVTPQDVVILTAPFVLYPFQYYYDGLAKIETLPRWDRFSGEPLPPFDVEKLPLEIESIKGEYRQKAYLITSYDQGYEKAIRDYMNSNFERLADIQFSPRIRLLVYRVGYYEDNSGPNPFVKTDSAQIQD